MRITISTAESHSFKDRNILNDAWHDANRMQAESLLEGKPVGTYLFRKDPYAAILEKQLEEQMNKKIQCFTFDLFSRAQHSLRSYDRFYRRIMADLQR